MTRFHPLHRILVLFLAGLLCLPAALQAQDMLDTFEDKVTEFTLDNGLTFLVIERHNAPVFSYLAYADVGSVDEPIGQTGIAHMFEHMAFKGTTTIGTKDIEAEMEALRHQEDIYLELQSERAKGPEADEDEITRLENEMEEATEAAKALVESNEYDRILDQAGATGLNASTYVDWTRYYYSLPANKLELMFLLESDRFINPVLREYYTERDVVMEERRMRTESSPVGRLLEEFLATAFKAHPYGSPTIGHMSDLQSISRTEALAFYEKYYTPSNVVIAVAGDVRPDEVQRYAEKYFGRLEGGDEPLPVVTKEPEQLGERRVVIREDTQPYVLIGYHRPSALDASDAAYTVLADVLSRGRTSRFHEQLVETEKALNASAIAAIPGDKYPTLFAVFGLPSSGTSPEGLEADIYTILDEVAEEGITDAELERAKTRARTNLIQRLDSNTGLASMFAQQEALTGDWRAVFRDLQEIQDVTVEDVQEVAEETFQQSNRTVGMIKTVQNQSGDTASAQ